MGSKQAAAIREQSDESLVDYYGNLKREQANIRFRKALGDWNNSSRERFIRKEIARVKTILREQEKLIDSQGKVRRTSKRDSRLAKLLKGGDTGRLRLVHPEGPQGALRLKPIDKPSELSSDLAMQYVRNLRSDDSTKRIVAMQKLSQNVLSRSARQHTVAKLIPMLTSENADEALQAAITICTLSYPDNYAGKDRSDILVSIRNDLPRVIQGRHVDYVTHVNAEKQKDGVVRVSARLSDRLPLPLDGWFATLDTPEWIRRADDFTVVVSGPSVDAKSVKRHGLKLKAGDIGAMTVECRLVDEAPNDLTVDFIVDNRHLKSETVTING